MQLLGPDRFGYHGVDLQHAHDRAGDHDEERRCAAPWFPVVLGITAMAMAVKAGASSWIEIAPNITVKTYIMITVVLRAML